MYFLKKYLRQHSKIMLLFLTFTVIFVSLFVLYHLPLEAVLYPTLLCMGLGLIVMAVDYHKSYVKYTELLRISDSINENIDKNISGLPDEFPKALSLEEKNYQEIISKLVEVQEDIVTNMDARYSDMIDYYTVWAHQIKTPIASMRLNIQNEDSEFARQVSEDLLRIEQYVEMVLTFLRLDSDSTDYCFKELDLDELIRQIVKKFSTQFIRRRIALVYEPVDLKIITDEKWLSFCIEQVLSNALKYTNSGTITIGITENKKLYIKDTGIGIAPEDLPRIFEKGYTGYNGRTDKKATGIGLYLCRRILNNLGHTIKVESALEEGTSVYIDMSQKRLETE